MIFFIQWKQSGNSSNCTYAFLVTNGTEGHGTKKNMGTQVGEIQIPNRL